MAKDDPVLLVVYSLNCDTSSPAQRQTKTWAAAISANIHFLRIRAVETPAVTTLAYVEPRQWSSHSPHPSPTDSAGDGEANSGALQYQYDGMI